MIDTIIKNLDRGIKLLDSISEEQYTNSSVAPYHSSIGGHIRHILDVFDCVFKGRSLHEIDLTERTRDLSVEQSTENGKAYIDVIKSKIEKISSEELRELLVVCDDLGGGKEKATYSLGAILIQAHSHAIHHYASIGYIIHQLGIELPDDSFGFNPTTPKKVLQA